jgi:hypothetical protein
MKKLLLVILTFLLSTTFILGQTTSGRIVGTVSAPDGAIPGATIVVRDNQTGREQTVTASSEGNFTVSALEFGTYTVTITAAGYKTLVSNDVKIDAGREYPLNAVLEVGAVTEEVTVTAGAEQINSTTGELSTTVSPQQIRELPLNGRNPLSLLNLQAGVNVTSSSINGQRASSVNYTRDGLNVQDNFIRNGFVSDQPSVDDTGEFNVVTQNAGAELGSGSTQVQLVTPRGGSEYSGALYAFNRNSQFASNTFFGNTNGLARPFLNRNQFGGSLGGPLPFFNFGEGGPTFRRDKSFFFFNYEGFRLANQVTTSATTLLAPARNGNFTYTDSANVQRTINVLTGAGLNLTPAANQTVFSSAGGVLGVDPIIQRRILDQAPTTGNGITTGTNFLQTVNFLRGNPEERNSYAVRADFDINNRNTTTFIYKRNNIIDARTDIASGFNTGNYVDQGGPTNFFAAAYQMTPTNNFSNEIRGGFQYAEPFFNGNQIPTDYLLGIPLLTNPEASFRSQGRNTLYKNIQDNAVYTRGNHSFRFGVQAQTYNVEALNDAGITPTFSISSTANTQTPGLTAALFNGGINTTDLARANSLRYLLGGIIGSGSVTANLQDINEGFRTGSRSVRKLNFETYSAYISDQWRATSNLTLNLGLRYELYTPLNDPRGLYLEPRVTNFDNPVADLLNPNGVYQLVGGNAGKKGDFFKPDKNNFGPNISFAYSPKFENGLFSGIFGGDTVLRGGFRVNYNNDEYIRSADNANLNNSGLGSQTVNARSDAGLTTLRATLSPVTGFQNLPTNFPNPTLATFPLPYSANNTAAFNSFGTVSLVDPNLQVQKSYEYNVGIQREIGFKTVLELRYVGGRSDEVTRSIDYNQINVRDSGFLADVQRARQNCILQGQTLLTGPNDTRNPLTICTNAAFNASIAGSQQLPVLSQIGFLNNATILNEIRQGTAGELASVYLTNGLVPANVRNTLLANPNTGVANFTTNGGKYRYNSLQVEVRRRFSEGFAFQSNYTFGKVLADVVDDGQTRVNPFLDNANPQLDYGRPDYDRTHTLNTNFIYELPFGQGKRFLNQGGLVNAIFGGFQFSSIITLSSGVPLGVIDPRGTLNRGGRSGRQSAFSNLTTEQIKDLTGVFVTPNGVFSINPSVLFALGSNGQRIDLTQPLPAGVTISSIRGAAAVDQPAFEGQVFFLNQAGQVGNLPRNFINGPKFINWDAGLSKNFRITETMRIQLRGEVFNVMNRANFFVGDYNVNSTSFGRILSTYAPRVVQFGARFDF